jgi:hypothetical protein
MRRSVGPRVDARRVLIAALVGLGVSSVLPARWLGWAGWFGTLAQTLAAPISHPVARVVRWAGPPAALDDDGSEGARVWRRRAEEFETLYLRERAFRERLEEQLQVLQLNAASVGRLDVRLLAAPVIGGSSDLSSGLLALRVERDRGITPGTTIAVVEGVQLLGRVDSVRGWVPMVRPITDRAAGRIEALVVLGDPRDPARLLCSLTPAGDGTLSGPVADPSALPAGVSLEAGQVVRLADPSWPASAQQLVIGFIERIEPNPEQPLRRMIVVRPAVDLARVSEVVLRIPVTEEGGAGGGP